MFQSTSPTDLKGLVACSRAGLLLKMEVAPEMCDSRLCFVPLPNLC